MIWEVIMKKKFLSFVIVASNLICCACNFNIVSANDNSRSKSKIAKPSYPIDSVSQSTSSAATYGSIYENITTEVLQIQSYISKKMYLEAISLCNKVLNTRKISDADINLLNEYKNAARTAYKAYVDDLNKNKTTQYYISDWCMGYKFFDMYKPIYDTSYINVFSDSYTGDYIWVYSYEIGAPHGYLYNETIKSPKQYVSGFARYYKENFHDCNGNESNVEILSENDTTVGNFPARQVTLRTSIDLNRYGTSKYYTIVRCTAFQYGRWVYIIVANKNSYSWGDDFWNKMELVRNSISFY